ncbi:DUF6059 family protein [Streptomyces sp. NBC_00989]|uniref:DUF6059 family protein n=1 Tax=Streptomyces sp. NBC_00989 TaxID=2903705 RepID=UPI0038641CCE|nr:hypothetical protein OG714_31595 [Streptomyces sp. NBC_00989]
MAGGAGGGWWRRRVAAFRKWCDDLLIAFGLPYLCACAETDLQEPPAGHPERLRPDRPLTAYELWLTKQFTTEPGMRKAPSDNRGRPGQRPNR